MKHELEDQLKAFEKKGIDRRHFFKLMAMAGLLTAASTQKAKHFQQSQRINCNYRRRCCRYQYGCPFKELAGQAGYHFDRSQ